MVVPVKTDADETAGIMLGHLLSLGRIGNEVLSAKTLAQEALAAVAARGPEVVCLSAVRPFAVMQARYLAKRLRTRFPDLKILVGVWDPQTRGGRGAPQPGKRARRLGGGDPGRRVEADLPGRPVPAGTGPGSHTEGSRGRTPESTKTCGFTAVKHLLLW